MSNVSCNLNAVNAAIVTSIEYEPWIIPRLAKGDKVFSLNWPPEFRVRGSPWLTLIPYSDRLLLYTQMLTTSFLVLRNVSTREGGGIDRTLFIVVQQ